MKSRIHWICFSSSLLLLLVHAASCHSQLQEDDTDSGRTPQRRPKPPLIEQPNKDNSLNDNETPKTIKPPTESRYNQLCGLCRTMYQLSDKELDKTQDVTRFCVRLEQVRECISGLRREGIRCPMMRQMVLKAGVTIQMRNHECDQRNVTAHDLENIFKTIDRENKNNEKNPGVTIGQQCRYRQNNTSLSSLRHCGMFGDPHLMTFFGDRQTCIVEGEWTLLENEYMRIKVTNEIVQDLEATRATATKKV